MIDKIATRITENNGDLLDVLHEYCSTKHEGEIVRYGDFVTECSNRGISVTEDSWYDLMEESKSYTFAEDCDLEGAYWTVGRVVPM